MLAGFLTLRRLPELKSGSQSAMRLKLAKPHLNRRYKGQLSIVPSDDVLTIGHAFSAYIQWKRLVAIPSHFQTKVALVNYHIVPRLAHLPVPDVNHAHLNAFCVDVLETPPNGRARPVGPKRSIARA